MLIFISAYAMRVAIFYNLRQRAIHRIRLGLGKDKSAGAYRARAEQSFFLSELFVTSSSIRLSYRGTIIFDVPTKSITKVTYDDFGCKIHTASKTYTFRHLHSDPNTEGIFRYDAYNSIRYNLPDALTALVAQLNKLGIKTEKVTNKTPAATRLAYIACGLAIAAILGAITVQILR